MYKSFVKEIMPNVWSTNVGFVLLNLCMQKDIFPDNFDGDTVIYQNLSDKTYLPLSGDKLLVDADNEDDYNDENIQWALYYFLMMIKVSR